MSETSKAPLAGCATNLLHVEKLKEEQDRAYAKCCEQIARWENFKADYDVLLKRLETLPQKLSYDAMVPFGSVALMPGKVVHTNEITVLLGDNWFVERSAKQACDIIGRRINQCDVMLKTLQIEEKQFKKWMGYTDMIKEETEQAVEIREEYDEASESAWKEQHKRNVQKYHQQLAKERSQMTNMTIEDEVFREKESPNPKLVIDEAITISDEAPVFHRPSSSSWSGGGGSGDSDIVMPISKARRVSWQDQSSIPRAATSDEEDEIEEEEEEEEDDSSDEPEPLRINFTHCAYTHDSSSESSSSSSESEAGSGSPTQTFQSPADLYVHFATLVQKPPKSILKKSSTPRGPDPETQPSPQLVNLGKAVRSSTEPEMVHSATVLPTASAVSAVSSQVIERAPTEAALPSTSASRPTSRFKAQRQAAHR